MRLPRPPNDRASSKAGHTSQPTTSKGPADTAGRPLSPNVIAIEADTVGRARRPEMTDHGRMSRRLASSYRQDDLRRADDTRRMRTATGRPSGPAAVHAPGLGLAALLRLIPRRA